MAQNFEIKSAQRTYPVNFINTLPALADQLLNIPNAVVLIDEKVKNLYQSSLGAVFAKFPTLAIAATEENKTFVGVETVVDWFVANNVNKANHILVIGGGIIQDISAFSAGIYFRGLTWTFVPTTLLAMSDSCIGAKTGINWKAAKNQLGVFNSPFGIYICTEFLKTLDPNDIKSGYGEILKLHLTAGYEKFLKLEADIEKTGHLDSALTATHIYDSLMIKKSVIEIDEYEKDLRRILNFGHTFGHALESVTNHSVPHGLAVAWGIDFVNFLSMQAKELEPAKYQRVKNFIKKNLSQHRLEKLSAETLLSSSKRDKKAVSAKEVNMVFFTDANQLKIKKTTFDEGLSLQLTQFLSHERVF